MPLKVFNCKSSWFPIQFNSNSIWWSMFGCQFNSYLSSYLCSHFWPPLVVVHKLNMMEHWLQLIWDIVYTAQRSMRNAHFKSESWPKENWNWSILCVRSCRFWGWCHWCGVLGVIVYKSVTIDRFLRTGVRCSAVINPVVVWALFGWSLSKRPISRYLETFWLGPFPKDPLPDI